MAFYKFNRKREVTAERRRVQRKKKWFIVGGVVFVVGVCAVAAGISMKQRFRSHAASGGEMVQSRQVEKGTISNTIEGSGSLEVAETVDVTVPAGIKVKMILVESGDRVTKGQTLATLEKTSIVSALADIEDSLDAVAETLEEDGLSSLQKAKWKAERSELKQARKVLRALRKNPVITAVSDGVIGSVNISEGEETAQTSSSLSNSSSSVSGSSSRSATNMSVSAVGRTVAVAAAASVADGTASASGTAKMAAAMVSTMVYTAADTDSAQEAVTAGQTGENTGTVITDFSKLSVAKPVTAKQPQTVLEETDYYTGKISWNCATDTFQPGVAYTAAVILTAKNGNVFSQDFLPEIAGAVDVAAKISVVDGNSVLMVTAKYAKTALQSAGQTASPKPSAGAKAGSKQSTDKKQAASQQGSSGKNNGSGTGGETAGTQKEVTAGKTAAAGKTAGTATGNTAAATQTSSSKSSDLYSGSEAVAFTLQSQSQVMISLNVDELDILSVEKGQKASITLDAIEDKEFEGTVTKVAGSASASDGNAKYVVEILLEKNEDMRIGMSASATIQVSEASDVLTIPMNALQQKGETTFVYTKKDDEGNLSGEVNVETGLSDGDSVEITDGLAEGDTVYYTRTGSAKSSSSAEGMRGGFPDGDRSFGGGFQKGNGGGNGGFSGGGQSPFD